MTRSGPLAVLALAALVVSCGSPRRGEPIVGPIELSPLAERGQVVFMARCQQCYPGGEGGLGPAINHLSLPRFLIELQVRQGLGAMPAFPPHEVPQSELDALSAYLVELRRLGPAS